MRLADSNPSKRPVAASRWVVSWRADPLVRVLADRHYSRQTSGHAQFVAPGSCLVLRTLEANAAWVTLHPLPHLVKHGYGDAWICAMFRNESPHLSSELIHEAVAATHAWFISPPPAGFLTFVDEGKIRRKRDPGRCFRRAGWREVGRTKERGLIVLQLPADECDAPVWPLELQTRLAV
jgi:hypothetical protein